LETAQADRTEPALANGDEGRRDLFGRGVRLVVSYIRMHPQPFAIAVIGAFLFATGSVAVTVALGWVTDRVRGRRSRLKAWTPPPSGSASAR
jgi:hypothetical protein